jgi:hypothetical protein
MTEINCVDLVVPLVHELDSEGVKFQIMGGVGSVALAGEFISVGQDRTIHTRDKIHLSQFRDNGSKRDVDVLVLSDDDAEIYKAEKIAQEVIGDELEISIFGLKTWWDLAAQKRRPVKSLSKVFLADRYTGIQEIDECYKALFPFIAPIEPETLETWYVPVQSSGSRTLVPIPHPGATILNYATRSVSGIRPKDKAKLDSISTHIHHNFPGIRTWLHEGPGREQLLFARMIHSLRQPLGEQSQNLTIGDLVDQPTVDLVSILQDERYSLVSGLPSSIQRASLEATRLKARVLHWGEEKERIVTMFQNVLEKRFDKIVKNK